MRGAGQGDCWSGCRPRRATSPPRCAGTWPTIARRCRICSGSCGRSGSCGTTCARPAAGSTQLLPAAGTLDPQARAELAWAAAVTADDVGRRRGGAGGPPAPGAAADRIEDPFLRAVAQLAMAWTSPITGDFDGALREAAARWSGSAARTSPSGRRMAALDLGALETAAGPLRRRAAPPARGARPGGAIRLCLAGCLVPGAAGQRLAVAAGPARSRPGTLLDEALDQSLAARSTAFVTLCLAAFAQLAFAEGDPDRAALLAAAAEGLRRRAGLRAWPVLRRGEAELVAQIRQTLGAAPVRSGVLRRLPAHPAGGGGHRPGPAGTGTQAP